jgi:ribosome recycling factor
MDLLKEDDSLSDDYRERVQDDLQKETDEANKKIDEILAIKQKEILTI